MKRFIAKLFNSQASYCKKCGAYIKRGGDLCWECIGEMIESEKK